MGCGRCRRHIEKNRRRLSRKGFQQIRTHGIVRGDKCLGGRRRQNHRAAVVGFGEQRERQSGIREQTHAQSGHDGTSDLQMGGGFGRNGLNDSLHGVRFSECL